ncbi:hypothetical protein HPB50_004148 [Hyalomma asiaticum]|uniref:Uncharacterized protein n=1 Tax=Hyalomma asiaticum TaxID=266040 RepID=A0ACB7SC43_HYAAI|nr:hypothetical protein HPB50_004148 [Hyalomma asiaticum]
MSQIAYVAAAYLCYGYEKAKLEALMHKNINMVLGVPMHRSQYEAQQMGIHNTLFDVVEAQWTTQLIRLPSWPAGRRILEALGCNPAAARERRCAVVARTRKAVTPSPKTQGQDGRAIRISRGDPCSVCFDDASRYSSSDRVVAAVVDQRDEILSTVFLWGSYPALARHVAVAFALLDGSRFRSTRTPEQQLEPSPRRQRASPHPRTQIARHSNDSHGRVRGAPQDPLQTFNEIAKDYQLARIV